VLLLRVRLKCVDSFPISLLLFLYEFCSLRKFRCRQSKTKQAREAAEAQFYLNTEAQVAFSTWTYSALGPFSGYFMDAATRFSSAKLVCTLH